MRGLTDDEAEILRYYTNGYSCPHNRGPSNGRVFAANSPHYTLIARGLLMKSQVCPYHDEPMWHPLITPAGRLVLQLDTAARNLDVNKDFCV